MPLIESQSFTDQSIAAGKSISFIAAPDNYDSAMIRVWLYDLAAASSAKVYSIFITKASSGIESRASITSPTLTTTAASVALFSLGFPLGIGDVVRINVVGGAGDTANVDIVAELWGIPDLSALITTVDTVVDAIKAKTDNLPTDPADQSLLETYITTETTGLATSAALGLVSSVVNGIDSRLPSDPADQSLLMAEIGTRATPADVVSYVAVTAADAATLAAGNVAFKSYSHTSQGITSTSTEDLSSATKVWFALKDSYLEDDDKSLIFIEKTAGLTYVGKSAIVSPIVTTDGSLTVGGSSGAWTFTVVLKSEAAAYLADYAGSGKLGEIKATIGGLDKVIGTVTGAINSSVIRTNA